ncbi:MAG TPA: hypothetical protein V7791_00505 [Candidatus Azoamicus sp. OHIO1]
MLDFFLSLKIIIAAINIDEYVPIIIPNDITKENPNKDFPPNIAKTIVTNSVDIEVISVLDNVLFIDLFIMSILLIVSFFFEYSLILSNTTIVSLIEYPKTVNNAANIVKSNSISVNTITPEVIITSWIRASIALIANIYSNLYVKYIIIAIIAIRAAIKQLLIVSLFISSPRLSTLIISAFSYIGFSLYIIYFIFSILSSILLLSFFIFS